MGLTRRQFLGATLGAGAVSAAGAGYAWGIEPTAWEITRTAVRVSASRGLSQPIKLLHLADLHASPAVPLAMIREALLLGVAENPDLIAVTGDFFTGIFNDWEEYQDVLRVLSDTAPTFAILGNHDGQIDTEGVGGWATRAQVTELLGGSGMTLLYNESRRIEIKGQFIDLFGVGDLWRRECFPNLAFSSHPIRGSEDAIWRIALNHNPDAKTLFAPFDWDLMLCGHTHGGQVVVPLVGPLWVPVQDRRFIAGLYRWENRQLFVTRGVGNLHGVRLNCRPEISVLELS